MPTYIYTRKRFLEFVETLKDDDIVLLSAELSAAQYSKKQAAQKVTIVFASDVFARKDTVGHFAKNPTWCFCVVKREDLSEGAAKIYDENPTK